MTTARLFLCETLIKRAVGGERTPLFGEWAPAEGTVY